MNRVAAVAGAVAIGGLGLFAASQTGTLPLTATETTTLEEMNCNDWPKPLTQRECFAAGWILTSLANLQPGKPFCVWVAANPGEWSRLVTFASSRTPAQNIVTWQGGSIRDAISGYFAAGAPPFTLPRTPLPPNACGGKLLSPPAVQGVTPGQTDVTVTVAPSG